MSDKPRWHKLPPVPGWYASVLMNSKNKNVDGVGANYFSEWKISDTVEQKNVWYYGPLPIEELER